jgi:hypothetical protein
VRACWRKCAPPLGTPPRPIEITRRAAWRSQAEDLFRQRGQGRGTATSTAWPLFTPLSCGRVRAAPRWLVSECAIDKNKSVLCQPPPFASLLRHTLDRSQHCVRIIIGDEFGAAEPQDVGMQPPVPSFFPKLVGSPFGVSDGATASTDPSEPVGPQAAGHSPTSSDCGTDVYNAVLDLPCDLGRSFNSRQQE